jgi:hypothetical protein
MVADADQRLTAALERIAESERLVLGIEERIGDAEGRVKEAASTAERVSEWEARMRDASRVEEEAARRISGAEDRIRDLLGNGDDDG